ncbi:type VII secretion protein EsaA [Cytobacillus oceanisediminis]|uniref:type VII secretion protein EsaA n=1 Tax=Cytobacillus TaxID=2675230 RepID=UPI00204230B6|nr:MULTISPECIES: type VII secretion protein EsaA [Cytobacillus]MBY0162491.1 type VII secretion protein EsaA [Cytobacillus firmus]MCM3395855.1 type VII secretion protein EsaA [Cytobacillus oceanisediminis]MCM3532453.1 type VII secretion protein EsaA [Cytobacillus oceanisediminis]UQX53222.1 type VII secretion protein EsaA [Cytobacillus pseudoceanisediminis]
MTAKTKYIVKMVLVMLLIIAAPAIFFGSIGDNPLLVRENATRTIAVVNEDTGADKEEKSLDFGEEITSILQDGSQYEWTVIGRSAAENGLKNTKYDAVVYIPSNFSKNIMSYESKQPEKASFEYTVQNQLNSLNREKVLREIQTATNRVNGKISTLYWTYVSQDLENVKSQFDTILQKEIDFQNAMLAFYKPSSKNLAEEIEQQRNMLESIQSTVKTTAESTTEGENNLSQFEENLGSFVQFVDQYKEYQDNQQNILQKMQDENVVNIQAVAGKQQPTYSEALSVLNKGNQELAGGIDSVEKQLEENSEVFGDLSAIRNDQVGRQMNALKTYFQEQEAASFNKAAENIGLLKGELSNGQQPGNPGAGSGTASNKNPGGAKANSITAASLEAPSLLGMEEERNEILSVEKEITNLKTSLETIEGTKPEQVVSALTVLPALSQRLIAVEQKLAAKDSGENPLQKIVEELQKVNAKLIEDLTNLDAAYKSLEEEKNSLLDQLGASMSFSSMINLIEEKEQQIIELGFNLAAFNNEITNTKPVKMMEYYASLIQYEDLIKNSYSQNPEKVEELVQKLNSIVAVNEEEQKVWDNLNTAIPSSQQKLTDLEGQFTAFFTDYNKKIKEQQAAIETDLNALQENANSVREQIQTSSTNTPVPVDSIDGTSVMVKQEGISQRMLMINDLVGSIGENQSNIVSYTSELEQKVQSVQQDADTLNSKWGSNVETTQMFRDDIYNLLGNTYVNGQKNGPVYEQLSNPLQISGETAAKKEESKLPPVVVLAIVLLSSLMIGYFSHYFKNAPMLVHASMFVLLNLIVGLIISIFGLNIYSMEQDRAIEWTIFTILLLTAASAIVLAGFKIGNLAGWILSVGLIAFFISPFLALTAPNINYEDPMSKVYMSIQYDSQSLFVPAILILLGIIAFLAIIPFAVRSIKDLRTKRDEDQAYEA